MHQDKDGDDEVRIPRAYWDAEFAVGEFSVPALVGQAAEAPSRDEDDWPEFGPTPDCWHLMRSAFESVQTEFELWAHAWFS